MYKVKQRLSRLERFAGAATVAGILAVGSGCVGSMFPPDAEHRAILQQQTYQSYNGSQQSTPIPVDLVWYEGSSGDSSFGLNLLSFVLGGMAQGMAQQGFATQAVLTDIGSGAVGRQAVIEGQREAVQQGGRSMYWPGSKEGALITNSKQFGTLWTIAATGYAKDGTSKNKIDNYLGTSFSFSSSQDFGVGCMTQFPMVGGYTKIIDESGSVVITTSQQSDEPHIDHADFSSGTLKPGNYMALFYGQVPYEQPKFFSGPPRGRPGQEYILSQMKFRVTP